MVWSDEFIVGWDKGILIGGPKRDSGGGGGAGLSDLLDLVFDLIKICVT